MKISLPSEIIFYTIERAIKDYRKLSQKKITTEIEDLTLDQGLVLLFLNDRPGLAQNELGDLIFRDSASVTRMINSLVKKKYLKRSQNEEDRRRYELEITPKGKKILNKLSSIISENRNRALKGVDKSELNQLESILNKIISNCKTNDI